jgi:hypothetical protein
MRWLLIIPILLLTLGHAHAQTGYACSTGVLTWTPISFSTAATNPLVTGATGKNTYVCKLILQTNAANNVAIVEGTGTSGACSSSLAGMMGGTTAATGFNLPANGQLVLDGGGQTGWAKTAVQADNVCLINSASTQLSGVLVSVQQ